MFRTPFVSFFLAIACLAAPAAPAVARHPVPMPPGPAKPGLVDVNVASRAALMKLPGITGPVADRIIQGRPYLAKTKLVTQGVIPMDLYQQIRNLVVVHPKWPVKK